MSSTTKTYKREAAAVMLAFLGVMAFWGVWEPEAQRTAEYFTLPIFTFAGGAFALDAVFKQGGR